jgi:Domain of unknown function (DUF932)
MKKSADDDGYANSGWFKTTMADLRAFGFEGLPKEGPKKRSQDPSADGTRSIQVKFAPVRVVCQNALNKVLSEGPSLRMVHTKAMYARLNKAAEGPSHVLAPVEKSRRGI